MFKIWASLLVTLFACSASAEDRYIVRAPASAINGIATRNGLINLVGTIVNGTLGLVGGLLNNTLGAVGGTIASLGAPTQDVYLVALAPGTAGAQTLQSLLRDPAVQAIEPDQRAGLPGVTTPPPNFNRAISPNLVNYIGGPALAAYVTQPAVNIIRAPEAHRFATGAGTVAFLDTGADFTHPVLAPWLDPGYDFTRNSPGGYESAVVTQSTTSILDSDSVVVLNQSTTSILDGSKGTGAYGHGTMVAGLIHLVAPTARLMPVKVFANDGTSSLSLILAGLYWAAGHGAHVINMSFSMSGPSPELVRALDYANAHRVVAVASVGNNGQQTMVYPAGYTETVGVASTNNQDARSSFSNYGNALVTVAAPGEAVITTYPGNRYAAGWGTSFSTPLVAGGMALLVQMNYGLDQQHARAAITHAVPVGQGLGAGRLDLFQACSYQATHWF
jgi:hypothetical protein